MTSPGQDFHRLRREGIDHIARSGSDAWTDYNTHDPGITILEALAYAITELTYRTRFPIEDILASAVGTPDPDDPYPGQPFFPARSVLTVNPTTVDDLRRLLIDVDEVRNAWVREPACGCDAPLFAWCENGEPVLSHDPAQRGDPDAEVTPIVPRGLYDVLLELEADPTLGDLNDRRITRRRAVDADGRRHLLTIETRFPPWDLARRDEQRLLAGAEPSSVTVTVTNLTRTTTGTARVTDAELRDHWFDAFYADFTIGLVGNPPIIIENVAVRRFGDNAVRRATRVDDVIGMLGDGTAEGFVEPYRQKSALVDQAIDKAQAVFAAHRNLDEDVCHVDLVEIVDVAVCAEVEVEPTADIELVQAKIWSEIERHLQPPVEFRSLQELLDRGVPVETIFNGPELRNGFLAAQEAPAAEVRGSDIIARLIGIPGVIDVADLVLTAYDALGTPVPGAAWLLPLRPHERPRLHRGLSRFGFVSGGLPFLPRLDEAEDSLAQLRGQAARPKLRATELDLPMPTGRTRAVEDYFPVQHSLPLVYGTGPAGLPSTATELRNAQARQLTAYLMVYEQLLRNGYAQVAHVGDLFSLDPGINRTYFTGTVGTPPITGPDAATVQGLVESEAEFHERRNRFLDHVLARFGEGFGEYALLLTDLEGRARASEGLARDKIDFLRAFPRISHDRGKGIDRAVDVADPGNRSGLQQRVELLLGLPEDLRRGIVVEHLLLRPKFPGDALFPVSAEGSCCAADPYSFRLTYVQPGWTAPFSTNITLRRFAERTIREQTPSHLLVKTCWVDDDPFARFEEAWHKWAGADAAIDWTQERLQETVLELLTAGAPTAGHQQLCATAATILTVVGTHFHGWLSGHVAAGTPPEHLPVFDPPPLPADLTVEAGVAAAIDTLLRQRYATYTDVSYRLHELLGELGALRNTYPHATLHDCDAGSDVNPVRLGQTALGSN
ncbi:hypothetical protein [Pseudonocardia sp. DLS-67]